MATTFKPKDAKTCFGCDSMRPSFRLIMLESFPTEHGGLEPDCIVGLFCEECLRKQVDDTFCSRLIMPGVPLKTVQELMGHKTIQMIPGMLTSPPTTSKTLWR